MRHEEFDRDYTVQTMNFESVFVLFFLSLEEEQQGEDGKKVVAECGAFFTRLKRKSDRRIMTSSSSITDTGGDEISVGGDRPALLVQRASRA
ncbi:hypothetical protein JOB18_009316 [Solea senegalensis]|uniref:Uncharacterized protein n=1 Tax=Solea senegalensis TaxID=28829 RepID=A0AAV6SMD3_SOLSE|nr:hypothetical protein JOB18_009316 [Solea senegalensis]